LISLTGFAGAVLNSYGYFAVPALTPVLLNVVLIGAAVWISPMLNEPALALAWGVILAGLLQLMFQLPFLAHLKLFVCPRLNWSHPGVSKVIKLMLPVLFSVSIGQIGLLLDTILATSLEGDGAVSWLYYSDRLLELPLGIFGVAIATVILPTLSRQHSTGQAEVFDDTLNWGLRVLTILGLPAMAALLVLAEPLVITLYQRGQFGPDSVAPTVGSLRSFSLGLLAFMWVKVLASAYFSRKDTKTPVRYGVIALVSNMVLNLLLIFPLGHIGLALATAMSAWVNTGLLCYGLMREKVLHFNYSWLKFSIQCVTALVGMILLLCWQLDTVENWLAWDELQRVLQLAWLVVSGAVTYSVLLLLTGFRPKHLYP
jgi:putative peptidoglycan lipid II flippase